MGDLPSIAGRVLAEKYLLIERLGEGGFGSIWRSEHLVLRSPIAVKLIDLGIASREGAVERFLREAQATAALRSPHVVQILDYGLDRREIDGQVCEQPFIVMELLEGENLAQRVERLGKLTPLEAVRIVTHVARAISRAHELGIVHRDLKPENIFIVSNGDEEVAKVLDFGVAKIASPAMDLNSYTQTGSMVGTPYYMSPEQAQGNKTVDYRSDLWALGVITFEMLTGQRPFDSDALGDLVLAICVRDIPIPSNYGAVPAEFDSWFARAVAREPDARFQSARELALALLAVVEAENDGGIGYAQFDERTVRPPLVRSATPHEPMVAEIPSRPHQSAFAATVRDDALALAILDERSRPNEREGLADEPNAEEHLGPWALFGMGLVALAAGAAAVYGLFFLLRDPAGLDEPNGTVSASSQPAGDSRSTEVRQRSRSLTSPQKPLPTSASISLAGAAGGSDSSASPPAQGGASPYPSIQTAVTSTQPPQDVPSPSEPGNRPPLDPKPASLPALLAPEPSMPGEPQESNLPAAEAEASASPPIPPPLNNEAKSPGEPQPLTVETSSPVVEETSRAGN